MSSTKLSHKAFGATRLVTDMVRLTLLDRISNDDFNRRMAEAWLSGDDAGMASFNTCCEHLANVSDLLDDHERHRLADGVKIQPETLQKPSSWRAAFNEMNDADHIRNVFDHLGAHLLTPVSPRHEHEDPGQQRDFDTPDYDSFSL